MISSLPFVVSRKCIPIATELQARLAHEKLQASLLAWGSPPESPKTPKAVFAPGAQGHGRTETWSKLTPKIDENRLWRTCHRIVWSVSFTCFYSRYIFFKCDEMDVSVIGSQNNMTYLDGWPTWTSFGWAMCRECPSRARLLGSPYSLSMVVIGRNLTCYFTRLWQVA